MRLFVLLSTCVISIAACKNPIHPVESAAKGIFTKVTGSKYLLPFFYDASQTEVSCFYLRASGTDESDSLTPRTLSRVFRRDFATALDANHPVDAVKLLNKTGYALSTKSLFSAIDSDQEAASARSKGVSLKAETCLAGVVGMIAATTASAGVAFPATLLMTVAGCGSVIAVTNTVTSSTQKHLAGMYVLNAKASQMVAQSEELIQKTNYILGKEVQKIDMDAHIFEASSQISATEIQSIADTIEELSERIPTSGSRRCPVPGVDPSPL